MRKLSLRVLLCAGLMLTIGTLNGCGTETKLGYPDVETNLNTTEEITTTESSKIVIVGDEGESLASTEDTSLVSEEVTESTETEDVSTEETSSSSTEVETSTGENVTSEEESTDSTENSTNN